MSYIIWVAVLAVSYFRGVFWFCQIIGSIQTRQSGFLLTILFWVVILAGAYLLARRFASSQIIALYFGYGISLIQSLGAGKIR